MTDCVKFTAALLFQLYLSSLSFASLETVKGYPQWTRFYRRPDEFYLVFFFGTVIVHCKVFAFKLILKSLIFQT